MLAWSITDAGRFSLQYIYVRNWSSIWALFSRDVMLTETTQDSLLLYQRKDMKGQSIVYAAIKFHFLHTWYSNIHTVGTWTLTLTKHLSWQRPLFWAGGKDENELPDQNFDMWQGSTAALRFVPSHQFAATVLKGLWHNYQSRKEPSVTLSLHVKMSLN